MSGVVGQRVDLPRDFAPLLIDWQRRAGRSGMPWQGSRDPYRVWLSEVMLQQTQVSTVLGYYARFLERFPNVSALAAAEADEVMALWSGLGYYSRARNLHRCAQAVVEQHAGAFPSTAAGLETLPGIGASTAAAIASFCFGERVSIVDGNVRRVLTRLLAFEGDLSQTKPQRTLWELAQALLPNHPSADDMTAYTQGLMDLGATVCTRSRPACGVCPMQGICRGHQTGEPQRFPVKTRTLKRRHESWWLLLVKLADGPARFWLQRRPASGIWAGLYCPPVFESEEGACRGLPKAWMDRLIALDAVSHSLSHRELRLHPLVLELTSEPLPGELPPGQWVDAGLLSQHGLPAPVKLLLQALLAPELFAQA
ncbi:MAG: A/G-specific adenine glycosylase [Hydrogenophaga sp.]|uniref:A/G-specific adenine glycosylase n=1 Tax=Hydrogenophaga sp. TaxID=1904254 RepID=UPI002ABC9AC1|nr:A/G-specific adenine glycosylase [Hydrogenophaga sp.]MDZ4104174.1 A/G-specific adenine glycosylase [Hydrogenophaga sp.]